MELAMRFRFNIEARRVGGFGVKRRFIVEREGANRDAAQLGIYDEYEHVNVVSVEILPEAK
jgi:hypothetical protein